MFRRTLIATLCCFIIGLIAGHLLDDARAANPHAFASQQTGGGTAVPKTLCEQNEQVVFSCSMKKTAKILSICTSKKIDAKNGYVQYRFGFPGKVELEFPTERKDTQSAFSYLRYTRPLVTLLKLEFESNGYKYSIHQDSNAEEKPAINVSSLSVVSPDPNAKGVEMTCREPVKGSLMLLEDVVPRSE